MGNNLAEALVALVRDVEPGFFLLLSGLCYLFGVVAFWQGAIRLLKLSEDRSQASSMMGTVLCFVLCSVFVSLPSWMVGAGESLFGAGRTQGAVTLGYGAAGAGAEELLGAVFTIVGFVGLIAFIKGAFMLRAAADGAAGATTGRAFAHLLGGVAAWHIAAVINAVQTSLGIQVLDIT